jgi:hypothetical protein
VSDGDAFTLTNYLKPTYEIKMGDYISVSCCGKIPNRWNRFWYKALLGWVVKEI